MNAAYTIRYENGAAVALEALKARAREMNGVTKATLMLAAAPLLGLAFVVVAPLAGLAVIAWMLMKALVRNRAAVAARAKRIALFFAAPFTALVYISVFPFVAMGMLVYYGIRAARS
jgi:hypothetical protein